VALVRTGVSEKCIASFMRVTRSGELGTLAVTTNRRTVRRNTKYSYDLDDVGDMFLRNVGSCKSHTASHARRRHSSCERLGRIGFLIVKYAKLKRMRYAFATLWSTDRPTANTSPELSLISTFTLYSPGRKRPGTMFHVLCRSSFRTKDCSASSCL
jgi:hypothetical protein